MEKKTSNLPKAALSAPKLKIFFINHLNRIHCAKSHLQERLPELRNHAHFSDLSNAITETLADVEDQLSKVDQIFVLLGEKPGFEYCQGVIGLMEDAFSAIHQQKDDPEMRDLSILFYLENIESIEMASFKMLRLAAPVIDQKEIRQLLQENFDVAKDDLALLRLISSHYFKK